MNMPREMIEERWEVWEGDDETPSATYTMPVHAYDMLFNLRLHHPKLKCRIKHVRRYRGSSAVMETKLARVLKLVEQLAEATKRAPSIAHTEFCKDRIADNCYCGASEMGAALHRLLEELPSR